MRIGKYIISIAIGMLLWGCEVIGKEDRFLPLPPPVSDRVHVLIEYTGFRCVNCPTAAVHAQKLANYYDSLMIVVSMHPATNSFTQGMYDYTCPAADVYYQYMGGTQTTPFPTGNIDFQKTNGSYLTDETQWGGLLYNMMHDSARHFIRIEATVDTVTREVRIQTNTSSYEATDCRMALWIVEDSVKGVQAMPDGSVNREYYHRHVLRGTIGDEWGTAVSLNKDIVQRSFTWTLPNEYPINQCQIIGILMDEKDHHILNANKTTLEVQ